MGRCFLLFTTILLIFTKVKLILIIGTTVLQSTYKFYLIIYSYLIPYLNMELNMELFSGYTCKYSNMLQTIKKQKVQTITKKVRTAGDG